MTKEQEMVLRFHRTFGIHIEVIPKIPERETITLRKKLIQEELDEFSEASDKGDLIGAVDGLGDLLYVVYGAGISYGVDLEPVFAEIHRSNMTKVGGYLREDGKWIKPDTYSPADILSVLRGI